MPDAIRLPSFRLDGRVAMVTGSGTGIGAGIASGFAEAGADLVLVGRTRARWKPPPGESKDLAERPPSSFVI